MCSCGPPHMANQGQDDQLEHTFSSYVMIRDVTLKTCRRRWVIGRRGERGSGISMLAARHDDDDDDISITIIVQVHLKPDSFVSDMNGFINFWLRSMATRGEKPMITILCWPHPNARRILWCLRSQFISAGRDPKNSTTCLKGRKPNCRLFKILKFSGPSPLGMTSSPLHPHFLFRGLLWQMVIVISFPWERKTAPND